MVESQPNLDNFKYLVEELGCIIDCIINLAKDALLNENFSKQIEQSLTTIKTKIY